MRRRRRRRRGGASGAAAGWTSRGKKNRRKRNAWRNAEEQVTSSDTHPEKRWTHTRPRARSPFPAEDRETYPEMFALPKGVREVSLPKPLGIAFEERCNYIISQGLSLPRHPPPASLAAAGSRGPRRGGRLSRPSELCTCAQKNFTRGAGRGRKKPRKLASTHAIPATHGSSGAACGLGRCACVGALRPSSGSSTWSRASARSPTARTNARPPPSPGHS